MRSGLKLALILFQHKGQEVEVETMWQLLEPLAEEQKTGAVEGRQVDHYFTEGNSVEGLIDVLRMVLEEGESEDTALTADEEGPKEEEVRNDLEQENYLNTRLFLTVSPFCSLQVFFAEMTFAQHL